MAFLLGCFVLPEIPHIDPVAALHLIQRMELQASLQSQLVTAQRALAQVDKEIDEVREDSNNFMAESLRNLHRMGSCGCAECRAGGKRVITTKYKYSKNPPPTEAELAAATAAAAASGSGSASGSRPQPRFASASASSSSSSSTAAASASN